MLLKPSFNILHVNIYLDSAFINSFLFFWLLIDLLNINSASYRGLSFVKKLVKLFHFSRQLPFIVLFNYSLRSVIVWVVLDLNYCGIFDILDLLFIIIRDLFVIVTAEFLEFVVWYFLNSRISRLTVFCSIAKLQVMQDIGTDVSIVEHLRIRWVVQFRIVEIHKIKEGFPGGLRARGKSYGTWPFAWIFSCF